MAGYLLNLTFLQQNSSTTGTGLFNDNSADATSKMWYQVPSGWKSNDVKPGYPISKAATNWPWTTLGRDDTNLGCEIGDDIFIRIAPSGWTPQNFSFYAIVGRAEPTPPPAGQANIASPFLLSPRNLPQTVFISLDQQQLVESAWIFYLGPVAQNTPGRGKGTNPNGYLYTFTVGLIAQDSSSQPVHYAHDPKIMVGGTGMPRPHPA